MMFKVLLTLILFVKYGDPQMEGHIMEGEFTHIRKYPHQVYVEIHGDNPCACGGSIISQAIVLTAAHCLDDYNPSNRNQRILVKYGSHSLNKMRMRVVKSYLKHEKYNMRTMLADLALLRCKTPMALGNTAKKVLIMANPPRRHMGYVAGWGAINAAMDIPEVLKQTNQEIQNGFICRPLNLPVGAFCAGPVNGPGKPYVGDSGGALIIEKYIQIGLVSYKAEDYTLVAYTNVSYYYPWIKKNVPYLFCFKP